MSEVVLTLKNDFSEITALGKKLEEFAAEGKIPEDKIFNINLALDELLTNTISYGYADTNSHEIIIRFFFNPNELIIQLEDDGLEFDPLNAPEPDLEAPLEERQIGGLGIHFVKTLMDGVEYKRENGKNILQILKKI